MMAHTVCLVVMQTHLLVSCVYMLLSFDFETSLRLKFFT